jgi:hypothetical protein
MASGSVTQLTGVPRDRMAGYRGGRAKADIASKEAESSEKSIVGRSVRCESRENLREVIYSKWEERGSTAKRS